MTSYVQIHDNSWMSDYVSLTCGFVWGKFGQISLNISFFAKQQSTSISIKYLDMSLHALQEMHIMVAFEMFKWYKLLYNKGNPAIYWSNFYLFKQYCVSVEQ